MSTTYDLETTLTIGLGWTHTASGGTLATTPSDPGNQIWSKSYTNGVGKDQADIVWASSRSLAATTETLTLTSGLTDNFGVALVFVKVKALAIWNTSTAAGNTLTVGNATHPLPLFSAGTTTRVMQPDERFILIVPSLAGIAVGSGATDAIKFDAGSNTVTYQIVIIGTDS